MVQVFSYQDLQTADLIIDAVYEGGSFGNVCDDPISRLLSGAGNQGGFRAAGRGEDKRFVVLYSSGEDKDWPDYLNPNSGQFDYYGDNKTPGHKLHDTGPVEIVSFDGYSDSSMQPPPNDRTFLLFSCFRSTPQKRAHDPCNSKGWRCRAPWDYRERLTS